MKENKRQMSFELLTTCAKHQNSPVTGDARRQGNVVEIRNARAELSRKILLDNLRKTGLLSNKSISSERR